METKIPAHKLKIAKAKDQAARWMPFLQSVFGPMRCIPTASCPRAAVDKYGRMYYNPDYVVALDTKVLAYIILHETLHLVLSHHARTLRMIPQREASSQKFYVANIAQDLCIQQTLAREVGDFEPENIVTFESLKHIPGISRNRTSEQYYAALLAHYEAERNKPQPPPPPRGDESDEDEEQDEDSGSCNERDEGEEDSENPGDSHRDGYNPDEDNGDEGSDDAEFGDGDGDTDWSDFVEGDEVEDYEDGDNPDNGASAGGKDGESGEESEDSGGGGDGADFDSNAFPEFGDVCNPADAGSASDGIEKEWEEDPTLADVANAENRLREALEELDKLNPMVGSGAGNIRQSLNARLRPLPDPFDQLRTVVTRTVVSANGSPDLTYRKWPRRQLPGKCRLRGVEKYTPEATVLLDTSGSMLSSEVHQKALAIVAKAISRLQNPRIVCCDGAVQSARRVVNMNQFQWDGGGGTDMAAGLIYVDKTYQPDAIVIITDGFTGWPAERLQAKVVCALCRGEWASKVPGWITTVHLYRKGEQYAL